MGLFSKLTIPPNDYFGGRGFRLCGHWHAHCFASRPRPDILDIGDVGPMRARRLGTRRQLEVLPGKSVTWLAPLRVMPAFAALFGGRAGVGCKRRARGRADSVASSLRIGTSCSRELISSGKLDEANAVLDNRLSAEPKDVQARFLKGMIAVARHDNRGAIAIFRSVLIDHPHATRVRLELARAFFLGKDYGNSLRQFQFALAGDPPREVAANISGYITAIRNAKVSATISASP